jgi:hypothetical protein
MAESRPEPSNLRDFPVLSLINTELNPETGSLQTASTATQRSPLTTSLCLIKKI